MPYKSRPIGESMFSVLHKRANFQIIQEVNAVILFYYTGFAFNLSEILTERIT